MNETLKYEALQQIGDLSNEGVVLYSLREKKVLYCNVIAQKIIGISESEVPGSLDSLLDLVIPEDREYLRNCFSVTRGERAFSDIEIRLKKASHEHIHICCNAFLISKGEDLALFIRDITKPKQHESYLVEFGARKNTLLDNLAHQISGALNLMRNLSTEAEKSITNLNTDNLRKYFSLLDENSKYCLQIINDLLRDEHFESEHVFVKTSRVDVVHIVRFIFEELKQSYSKRQFTLTSSSPAVFATVDDVKLLQIVNNLTSNALKFSPERTPIALDVKENEKDVIISVKDQGIGIPESIKPSIFDRHSGAGRTGLSGEKSTGVGLSICRNLARLIGGEIWFESEEGRGSTFYVRLPKE
jgi:two-component system, OmpR family, sensor histidine kinase VicK